MRPKGSFAGFTPVLLLTLWQYAGAQDFSITGIALGSDYDDAVQKLTRGGYQVGRLQFVPPNGTTGFIAVNKESLRIDYDVHDPPTKDEYLVQAAGGKVVAINHEVMFARSARTNRDETIKALKEKYGQSPVERVDTLMHMLYFAWDYDGSKRLMPQQSSRPACAENILRNSDTRGVFPNNTFKMWPVTAPNLLGNCSTAAYAILTLDQGNDQLVYRMHVVLVDMEDLRKLFESNSKSGQDRKNREAEAAKKNPIPN